MPITINIYDVKSIGVIESDLKLAMADSLALLPDYISVTLRHTHNELILYYSNVLDHEMHYDSKLGTKEFLPFLEYCMHKYESLEPLVETSVSYDITKYIYDENNLLENKYLERIREVKKNDPKPDEFTNEYLLTKLFKIRNEEKNQIKAKNEAISENERLKTENYILNDKRNEATSENETLKIENNKLYETIRDLKKKNETDVEQFERLGKLLKEEKQNVLTRAQQGSILLNQNLKKEKENLIMLQNQANLNDTANKKIIRETQDSLNKKTTENDQNKKAIDKLSQTVTTSQAEIKAKENIIKGHIAKHQDLLEKNGSLTEEKEGLLKNKNFSILIYQCTLGGIGGILLILSVVFGFCCQCKRNDKPREISSNSFHKEQIEIATQGTKEPERAKEKKEKKVEEVAEERHSIDELLETSEEENDYVSPAQVLPVKQQETELEEKERRMLTFKKNMKKQRALAKKIQVLPVEQQETEREEKERRMLTFKENMKKQRALAKKIKKKQKKMEKKRKDKESSILRHKKR